MRLDKTKIFDTETISARAMTLQTTSHGLDLDNPLAYELALYHVRFRGVEYTTFCSCQGRKMVHCAHKASLIQSLMVKINPIKVIYHEIVVLGMLDIISTLA